MAKKVRAVVKVQIEGGKATPAPPVGPALGQHGVNLMQFVKDYNARTANSVGTIIPAEITVFEDRSFTFVIKTPPASDLLKKATGVEKGSQDTPRTIAGTVTRDALRQIAATKMKDLNAGSVDAATKIIEGTAKSMGIQVEG